MNTDHCCIVDNSYIREEVAECCTLFHCNGIEFTHDIDWKIEHAEHTGLPGNDISQILTMPLLHVLRCP